LTLGLIASLASSAFLAPREEDTKLFRRIAGGDADALRVLYGQVADRAMAIALRLLKDRAEAEDVVQETFVEVWKRAGQYEPARGRAVAWITTIARNRALDRLRSRDRSARTAVGAVAERSDPAAPVELERAAQRSDRERVMRALSTLPAEQWQVIELAYFDGMTQSEIATHANIPLGTVKTRIRLGMAKLADLLGEGTERGA
jgi:RNA polymerase sigma-70 factor, ECF subfamily